MSQFKPYWMRHPHQLRAFSLVMLAIMPVVLPLFGLFAMLSQWRDIVEVVARCYGDCWDGLTHRMPTKPIVRPVARFFGWVAALMLPQLAIVTTFNQFAPNAPLWAFVVLYAGLVLYDIATRAHERKKARDAAGLDEQQAIQVRIVSRDAFG